MAFCGLRSTDFYVESIDMEAPINKHSVVPVYFLLPPPSPPRRRNYRFYNNRRDKHEIVGSCRGFILLLYRSDLILWNPSIGVHKRFHKQIPDVGHAFGSELNGLYGFGYDSSTDHYLLILIALSLSTNVKAQILVFSFKTNSWIIDDLTNLSYEDLGDQFGVGSLLNVVLHSLVFSQDKRLPIVISFDLIQRSLSEIPLLDDLTREKYKVYSLRIVGGCLSVCCSVKGRARAEIWVMKEYKVKSSWTKSIVTYKQFSPIRVTKDGGIFGSNVPGKLEKISDKGKLLEHLTYGGDHPQLSCINLQSAMYRESLVSLPRLIGENK